jgi:hypothetical protein
VGEWGYVDEVITLDKKYKWECRNQLINNYSTQLNILKTI